MKHRYPLIRWTLFLLFGLPFQLFVVYPLYPIAYLIARLFWQRHYFSAAKTIYPHYQPDLSRCAPIDFEKNLYCIEDNHNLLAQYSIAKAPESFQAMIYTINNKTWFLRKPLDYDSIEATKEVSGDCVVAWCFAAALNKNYLLLQHEILSLTKSYFSVLGSASFDEKNIETVSSRCNNFGLNWCPDGWGQLGQPMFGPNFYTTSALLALASYHSRFWKIVFWIHWLVLGGWYWAFMPAIYPKDGLWYARDIIMKALWVHLIIFGNRWWIRLPMKITNATVPGYNILFEAMLMTNKSPERNRFITLLYNGWMPDWVCRFWSQTKEGVSYEGDGDLFVGNMIATLAQIERQSRQKWG